MIEFTKPEIGEIRYQVFMTYDNEWWINKVKMTKCGRRWYSGDILKVMGGIDKHTKQSPELYYWHYLETLEDAYKMLIYNVFDPRDVKLFFRQYPNLEQLI